MSRFVRLLTAGATILMAVGFGFGLTHFGSAQAKDNDPEGVFRGFVAALSNGAEVIANDVDGRHLDILRERAVKRLRARLTLMPGSFPDGIDFVPGSLGAVLICRVMHFFDGPTIERAGEVVKAPTVGIEREVARMGRDVPRAPVRLNLIG